MEQKVTITLAFTRAEAETLHNCLDDWQSRLEKIARIGLKTALKPWLMSN